VATDWHLIEAVAKKLMKAGRLKDDNALLARIERIDAQLAA
jgi:hypothetical protein